MVSRFGSGQGKVTQIEEGRVFRGLPRKEPPTPTLSSQKSSSRQEIESRIQMLKQRLEELRLSQQANKFQGTGAIISRKRFRQIQLEETGLNAEISYLEGAINTLQPGEEFSSNEELFNEAQQIRSQAEKIRRTKQTDAKIRMSQREISKEKSLESKEPLLKYQESKEGFTITTKDSSGQIVTRAFNKEGQEIFLKSGVGLSESQYETREKLIKSGFIKEKSSAFGLTASPLGTTYSDKPQQKLINQITESNNFKGDIILMSSKAEVLPRQRIKSMGLTYPDTNFIEKRVQDYQRLENFISSKVTIPIYNIIKPQPTNLFSYSTEIASNVLVKPMAQRPVTTYVTYKFFDLFSKGLSSTFSKKIKLAEKISSGQGVALRRLKTAESIELSLIKIENGVAFKESYYRIKTEVSPPRLKGSATKGLIETIGIKKSSIKITEPIDYKVINNKPYLALTYKKGSNVGKIELVAGVQTPFSPKNQIQDLGKVELFTLKQLLKNTGGRVIETGGTKPVKFLDEGESIYSIGKIGTKKEFTINIKKKIFKFPAQTGKLTNRYLTITESRPFLETPKGDLRLTETIYKNINSPLARATGKTPRLKGNIFILNEPIVIESPSSKILIQEGTISKLKQKVIGLDYAKSILKTPVNKPSLPTQRNIITLKSIMLKTPTTSLKVIYPPSKITESKPIVTTQKVEQNQIKQIDFISVKQQPITKTSPSLKQQPKNINLISTKDIIITKQLPSLRPLVKTIIKQQPKQTTKTINKQILKQIFKSNSLRFASIISIKKNKEPPRTLFYKLKGQNKSINLFRKYPVLVRRKGKFKIVGFGRTPQEAFNIGREITSKTLAVTFKVPGVTIGKIKGYKKKKNIKEGVLFLELPKYRLSKMSEITEIQTSRKRR